MIISTQDPKRFDLCLVRFQAHDPLATKEFQTLVYPYLINLARKIGRQLPEDLLPEIVQQACLNLLGNSKMKFDPRRGAAKNFLVLAVRNAFRKVRTDYSPPGSPTRPKKSDECDSVSSAVSIEDVGYELGTRSAERQITARCDANSLLKKARPRVAVALKRIHYIGDTLNEVASDLNLSRFKLSREISAYCLGVQNVHSDVVTAYRFVC